MEFLDTLKKYVIPYEKHVYSSSLSSNQIKNVLSGVVEPKKFIRFSKGIFGSSNHKPYEGSVGVNDFKIQRIMRSNKNTFAPVIKGEVVSSLNNKSTVKLTFRLKYLPFLIMVFWFLIIFGLNDSFRLDFKLLEGNFLYLIFIPIAYVVTTLGFKYEANKSKKYFEELLKLDEPTDGANSWITRNS